MTSHVNQVIAVTIRGDADIEIVEPEKSILGISKDLSEEPNEAELEIYNLLADTRAAIKAAADKTAPIEIAVSGLHSSSPVRAFVGELDHVVSRPQRPGFVTRIRALSQKRAHRSMYLDKKTYAGGTPFMDIVTEIADIIALPYELDAFPTEGILLSHSYTGSAFAVLRSIASEFGMYCWIDDGILHISSICNPPNPTVIEITEDMLVTEPQESARDVETETEMHTVFDLKNHEPERKKTRRKKAVARRKEIVKDLLSPKVADTIEGSDYVEVEAVETKVPGIELECFAIPNLSPDHLITLDGGNTHYRVFETELYGDDLRGGYRPTTRIRADRFEGGL